MRLSLPALLVVIAVAFAPTTAFPTNIPPTQPLTLTEAQQMALKNHPQIKASDYESKAAEADIDAKRSPYYPQISANAIRAFADPNTRLAATGGLNNPTVIDRGSVGVGVSQLITDFGRTDASVEASKSSYEAQQQRANLSRAEVLLNATTAYYNALRSQELLRVAQDTLKTRQTFLDQVTSLHNVQMKSDLDLSIASQSANDSQLLLLRAQNNHADAMAALSESLGYNEPHNFSLTNTEKASPPDENFNSYLELALHNNPELAALQADSQASRHEAEAADKENYPTLSAVGFAGDTPIRTASQRINPTYATGGLNLSIPLFTGGKLTADTDKASYKADAADMRVEIKRNRLIRDIHTIFDSTQTSYKNIAVIEQMHKNAQKSLTLTQTRYEIGKSSIVDLNQALLAETQAAVAKADATYDYLLRRAQLEYETGKFSDTGVSR